MILPGKEEGIIDEAITDWRCRGARLSRILRRQGEAEARRTVAPLIGRKDVEVITDVGDPAGVLTEQARYWQADLLVVARHDRSALGRFWLGSVTERLLDGLPTSILVVPATEIEVEEHVPVAAVEVPGWHA